MLVILTFWKCFFFQVLCLLVAVCAVLGEGGPPHQPPGVSRRRPPSPSLGNRVQRAGPPPRMRNLAKRAHHVAPAKRGYYGPQRMPYSKPYSHRKMPKFPAYNKGQKPNYTKYGNPPKAYGRPPKSSYDSYSKPLSYGSYSPNSYQPKPYIAPSSYQYNPPQGTGFSVQSTSSKYPNQSPGYSAPSFGTSSQNQHSHSQNLPVPPSHSPEPSSYSAPVVTAPQTLPSSYSAPSLASFSSSPGTSYSVGTGSHTQSASTTYGVPHPTHGAPQPPSYASFANNPFSKGQSEQATSYVHFYQGSELPSKDSLSSSASVNTYSYGSAHYTENKHKGSVFDSEIGVSDSGSWNHQETKDVRGSKKSKEDAGNFKAPKQTFGFLPYDSDSRQSDKESNYGSNQGYYSDSVLSPNYYEQQSSSS